MVNFICIFDSYLTINGHRHDAPFSRLINGPFLWLKLTSDLDSDSFLIVYVSPGVLSFYPTIFDLISRQFPRLLVVFTRFRLLYHLPTLISRRWIEVIMITIFMILMTGSGLYYHYQSQAIAFKIKSLEPEIAALSQSIELPLLVSPKILFELTDSARQLPAKIHYFRISPSQMEVHGDIAIDEAEDFSSALNSLFSPFSVGGDFSFISSTDETVSWQLIATYPSKAQP